MTVSSINPSFTNEKSTETNCKANFWSSGRNENQPRQSFIDLTVPIKPISTQNTNVKSTTETNCKTNFWNPDETKKRKFNQTENYDVNIQLQKYKRQKRELKSELNILHKQLFEILLFRMKMDIIIAANRYKGNNRLLINDFVQKNIINPDSDE